MSKSLIILSQALPTDDKRQSDVKRQSDGKRQSDEKRQSVWVGADVNCHALHEPRSAKLDNICEHFCTTQQKKNAHNAGAQA